MAWVKTNPTDNGLLINYPGQQRANNDAIELGTDAALLTTNAKVAANAAIEESKFLFAAGGHGHTGGTGGKQIVLTTAVSGTLPVGNGGTGATAAANTANGVVILDGSGKVAVANIPTMFVSGMILLWSGSIATVPSGWYLCNGANGTPDLRNKFIIAAGDTYAVAATGGATTKTISEANLPAHSHASGTLAAANESAHTHSLPGSGSGATLGLSATTTGVAVASTGAGSAHGHTISGSTGAIGSGTALDVLNPYYALAYIMKS